MRKKITIFTATVLSFLLVFLSTNLIFAQNTSNQEEIHQKWQEKREKITEKIGENREERCERLTERIRERISRFEKNRTFHIEKYGFLKNKLRNIAERLKAKGYDVSDLQAHLSEVEEMVKDYAVEYQEFIDLLKGTQEYICGESEGVFRDAFTKARNQLKAARTLRREIREYYKNVIREDIKNLRNQKNEQE